MRQHAAQVDGFPKGRVQLLLRLESLAIFAGSLAAFYAAHGHWLWFGVLFLAPDLSFFGYLAGPQVGSAVYDFAHTYIWPVLVLGAGLAFSPGLIAPALIWIAHIGLDRALGYGLKYATGFAHTHLGPIGPARQG